MGVLSGHRSVVTRAVTVAVALLVGAGLLSACDTTPIVLTGTVSWSAGGAAAGITVTVHGNHDDGIVAQAVTDAGGRYRFRESNLPAGTYRIRFGDGSWWEGASTWSTASPVTVAPDGGTEIAIAIAATSGSMAGTATRLSGRPAAGVTVEATTIDGTTTLASTTTDAQGAYLLKNLSATSYAVRFSAPGYATRWWGEAATATASTPVVVDQDDPTVGVDITMTPASQLTGQVTGPGDLTGVVVTAAEPGTGEPIDGVATDATGRFTITGLPAGSYTIGATDYAGRYRLSVLGSTGTDLGAGTPVTVATGRTLSVGTLPVRGVDCPDGSAGADLADADLVDANLVNCDFTSTNLERADLRGADLTDATLSSARLAGADLRDADLDGALLFVADLGGATLVGASTEGLNVRAANLAGVDFGTDPLGRITSGSIVGTPARLPTGWTVLAGHLVGPRAALTSASLAGRNLSGLDLRGADLTRATLTGADLSGADLTGAVVAEAKLAGADVTGTTFTGAVLRGTTSGSLVGTPAALPTGWVIHGGRLFGQRVSVTGADLSGADLSAADLTGITSGDLTGTPTALPPGWVLVDGHLFGPNVTIQGANIGGADLSDANLRAIRAIGLTGTPTALPAGWQLHAGNLVGPGAQLRNTSLVGLDAPGADLAGASFTGADLTGADLAGARLTNVALPNATLTGADLSGADLTDANLAGAQIDGAAFAGATLLRIYSGGIQGTPTSLPGGQALVGGFLLGPGAYVPRADLSGADLADLDLSGARLMLATLDGSDLTGTDLTGAELDGATLDGATITGADLTDADLTEITAQGLIGAPSALPSGWELLGSDLVGPFW